MEVESDYRMDESTVIYDSIEKYVNYLNSDQRLRSGVGHEERSLLDNALYSFEVYPVKSKFLVNSLLLSFIKPKSLKKRSGFKKIVVKKLSKRKLRRKKYVDFQRLYKKKRKSAFDSLFSSNSISDT